MDSVKTGGNWLVVLTFPVGESSYNPEVDTNFVGTERLEFANRPIGSF